MENIVNINKNKEIIENKMRVDYKKEHNFDDDFEILDVPVKPTIDELKEQKRDFEKKQIEIKSVLHPNNTNTTSLTNKVSIEGKKTTDVIKISNKEEPKESFWTNFRKGMSMAKNNMKYNLISFNSILDLKKFKYVQIFDKSYNLVIKTEKRNFEEEINFITWMTYRSNFDPIITTKKTYTSDCGWGCMIRVSQMLLSQTLFRMKVSDYKENVNSVISFNKRYGLLINTLIMFMDNQLKYEEVKDNLDFKTYINENSTVNGNENVPKDISTQKIVPPFSIQNICNVGVLFNKSPGKFYSEINVIGILEELINNISLPTKLQILSFSEGVIYEKHIIDKCFKKVDWKCECGSVTKSCYMTNRKNSKNKLDLINNLSIEEDKIEIKFNDLTTIENLKKIEEETLIKKKEEELEKENLIKVLKGEEDKIEEIPNNINDTNKVIENKDIWNLNRPKFESSEKEIDHKELVGLTKMNKRRSNSDLEILTSKNSEILKCCCKKDSNVSNKTEEILIINDQKYYLEKRGLIFLIFRLGLDTINAHYYPQINGLFDIFNNLGIMGGKENNAFYYVGKTDSNNLIYVDPHYNQESIKTVFDLFANSGYRTYNSSEFLYTMHLDKMQPSFTFGLFFSNLNEYVVLMKDLKKFTNDFKNPIFKVKFTEDKANSGYYYNSNENDF